MLNSFSGQCHGSLSLFIQFILQILMDKTAINETVLNPYSILLLKFLVSKILTINTNCVGHNSPGIEIKSLYTLGPKPHFLGYVSRSIITRLILATIPWSQLDIVDVVMRAIAEIQHNQLYYIYICRYAVIMVVIYTIHYMNTETS